MLANLVYYQIYHLIEKKREKMKEKTGELWRKLTVYCLQNLQVRRAVNNLRYLSTYKCFHCPTKIL